MGAAPYGEYFRPHRHRSHRRTQRDLAGLVHGRTLVCDERAPRREMSTLDNISSVDMLESLITNDPRWSWILEEWESSSNKELVSLSETVHPVVSDMIPGYGPLIYRDMAYI